jgi:hypothetical protein
MLEIFSWELIMLLLANHAVATVVKALVPLQLRESTRFKRIVLPLLLWTITIVLAVFVVAPAVLVSVEQRVLFGFIISALQTQVFSAAKAIHPTFEAFDSSVEEKVKQAFTGTK